MLFLALVRWIIQPFNWLYIFLTESISHLQKLNNEVLTEAK